MSFHFLRYMIIVVVCIIRRISITIMVSHILQLFLWSTDTICWLSSKIDPLLRLILTHLNSEITWFSSGSFLYVNLIFYTVNWPVKRISWTEVQHPDPLPDHSIQYLWLCCLKQYHNPREAPLILVLVLLLKDSSTIHTFHPGNALRWQSPLGIRFRYKYSLRYHRGFVHWLPIFLIHVTHLSTWLFLFCIVLTVPAGILCAPQAHFF